MISMDIFFCCIIFFVYTLHYSVNVTVELLIPMNNIYLICTNFLVDLVAPLLTCKYTLLFLLLVITY